MHTQQTTVPLSVYESAVRGRRDMREAFRKQKKQIDTYGLALMMIREGCADPKDVAAEALAKFVNA